MCFVVLPFLLSEQITAFSIAYARFSSHCRMTNEKWQSKCANSKTHSCEMKKWAMTERTGSAHSGWKVHFSRDAMERNVNNSLGHCFYALKWQLTESNFSNDTRKCQDNCMPRRWMDWTWDFESQTNAVELEPVLLGSKRKWLWTSFRRATRYISIIERLLCHGVKLPLMCDEMQPSDYQRLESETFLAPNLIGQNIRSCPIQPLCLFFCSFRRVFNFFCHFLLRWSRLKFSLISFSLSSIVSCHNFVYGFALLPIVADAKSRARKEKWAKQLK